MPDDIAALRAKIDEIDDQILFALSERVKVCKDIGLAKKKQKMPIRDESRENEIYLRVKGKSKMSKKIVREAVTMVWKLRIKSIFGLLK